MLSDLFKRLRPNEPTKILFFRRFIIIMSLGLLVIIFVILCMGMYEELPSIKTTFTRADNIPAPDMKFSFEKHFTMVCSIHNNDGSIQNSTECGQYITQATYKNTYVGDFSPQGDLNFGSTGINYIMIYLISGESFNGSVIEMQAYDSEYSPYRGHFTFNNPTIDYDPFVQEIHSKNVYHLTNANSSQPLYNWKFSRYLRKSMDKSVLSYIGFRPNYIERPYIESSIQFIPFSGISNSIAIKLVAQSHTVIMETEQRSRTIGTIIGTMGGAWSAVLSFYVFLFGSDLVSSWGLAQKLLKSKPRLKEPELDEDNEDNEKEGGRNDLTDDLKKLIRKLEEHRMFYEEYVITIPSEKTTNS